MSALCATDYWLYIYESSSRLGDYKNGFNWILKNNNKNFNRLKQTTESTKQNCLIYNIGSNTVYDVYEIVNNYL